MLREYSIFNSFLDKLLKDVYPQPPDELHTKWTKQVMDEYVAKLAGVKTVLDVGCGQALAQPMFEALGMQYTGVTLGDDYQIAKDAGRNVINCDFTFLPYEKETFDLVFARHALEHSPTPIPTLMEWRRVSKAFLCLVAPAPMHWGWTGQNHYSVANKEQLNFWVIQSGWGSVWDKDNIEKDANGKETGAILEHWIMAEKLRVPGEH